MSARTLLAGVALLAGLVYANALRNGFALDDEHVVLRNERVHGVDQLDEALTSPYWPGAPARIGMYRPLTSASFALEWQAWRDQPAGYHATNVVLHVGVTALVFLLLSALAGAWPAAAGAAVFAVHPVHVEAVANVVGRGELLAATFYLLGCLAYVRARRGRLRWGWAAAVGGAYLFALGAKEIGATLPAALLVLETVLGKRGEAGTASSSFMRRVLSQWRVYLAAVAALLLYGLARARVLDTVVGNDPAPFLQDLDAGGRILSAIRVWPEYVRLMLFPARLSADYSPGVIMPVSGFTVGVALGLLVALAALALALVTWRRERLIGAGIAWFALAVLPVSNLVVPIGIALAERTLYIASVGLALVVAGVVRLLPGTRDARRLAAVAAALVLLAGAWRTWTRTPTWRDSGTVIATLAADHPESFRVQWVMAEQLREQGKVEEALARLRHANDLMPAHYQLRYQYAQALLGAGRLEDAAAQFDTARALIPEHPEAHVYLVGVLVRLGRSARAVEVGREVAARFPHHRGIHHQLALAHGAEGDYRSALRARRESIRLGGARAHWQQWVHLAELELRIGDDDSARRSLSTARDRAPAGSPVPSLAELRAAMRTDDPDVLPYRWAAPQGADARSGG